jgi:polysaccharide export outer membrane protein
MICSIPARITMVRRKNFVARISLFLSISLFSWGISPLLAAAASWDLWDDSVETLAPDAETQPDTSGEVATTDPNPASDSAATVEATSVGQTVDAAVATENVASADSSGYQIGPGDVLEISVWKDEALSRSVVVLPDGTISFPLIGKVSVAGKTLPQVRESMMKQLSRYVPDLELSVDVKQFNSMIVYVIGRVNAPGRQVLNSNVTVLQALAMAGGLNPFASRNSIKIFRKEGETKNVLTFRYNDVIDGDLETNVELKRGDVIVVP